MKTKAIKITLFLTLLLLVIVVLYFFTNKQSKSLNLVDAIGGNPAIIIKTKNISSFYNNLKTDCKTYQEINEVFEFNNSIFIDEIAKELIDSLNSNKASANSELILSIEKKGNKIYQTAIIKFDNKNDCTNTLAFLGDKNTDKASSTKRDYNGFKIFEINFRNNHLFSSPISNLLILSSSSLGVEQSIDAINSKQSLYQIDHGFNKIYHSSGKHEIANVFINLKEFPNILGCAANDELRDKIKNFANWACLDVSINPELLVLNGLIYDQDSINSFSKILKSQKPQKFSSIEILPDKTISYVCLALNNPAAYNKSLHKYLLNKNPNYSSEIDDEINKINSSKGIDIRTAFYDLIEDEICFSSIEFGNNNPHEYFTVLRLKSQNSSIIAIEKLIKQIDPSNNISEYKSEITISDKNNIPSYKLPILGLPESLFGSCFAKCKGKYVSFINNFMIFADTKDALFNFAYSALLNRTLATSIEHNNFLEQFSSKSLMLFYFSVPKGENLLNNNVFPDSLSTIIKQKISSGSMIGDLGFQINNIDNLLYNNIVIKPAGEKKVSQDQIWTKWESKLEDCISIKPTIVTNHDNNEKELIVQDKKNKLYLLNNKGIILWSIKISEPINSKIYQVDLYDNGKLQYLFSSENKIHVIDRLGNYIEKFPISLRSTSTYGISLFDYDKNHKYRIVVPCTDNKVYLYDGFGNIVKGWEFDKTEHFVTSEISHHIISSEDYIVFHDSYRPYFINRAGLSKIDFQTEFEFSNKNKIWFDGSVDSKRFVTTDKSGVIRFFYPDGTQDSLKLKDTAYSNDHFFALEDINGDGKLDYIILDNNTLEVYSRNNKLIFTHTFDDEISEAPIFFRFSKNETKIGIVSKNSNKIYLLNEDGTLFKNFPLKGNTAFSIGDLYNSKSGNFNLIVGGTENLLFNYEINTK